MGHELVFDHQLDEARAAVSRNVRGVLEVVLCSADLGRIPGWRNGMYARQDLRFLGGGERRGQETVGAEAEAGSGGGEQGESTGVEGGERVGFHYLGWAQGAGGELVYVSRSRGGGREVCGGREVGGGEQEGGGGDGNGQGSGFRGQVMDLREAAGLAWESREGPDVKYEEWEEEEELCALMCHGNSLSLVLAQGWYLPKTLCLPCAWVSLQVSKETYDRAKETYYMRTFEKPCAYLVRVYHCTFRSSLSLSLSLSHTHTHTHPSSLSLSLYVCVCSPICCSRNRVRPLKCESESK